MLYWNMGVKNITKNIVNNIRTNSHKLGMNGNMKLISRHFLNLFEKCRASFQQLVFHFDYFLIIAYKLLDALNYVGYLLDRYARYLAQLLITQ